MMLYIAKRTHALNIIFKINLFIHKDIINGGKQIKKILKDIEKQKNFTLCVDLSGSSFNVKFNNL